MSTFLQLVKRLRTECGVSGTNNTVELPTGEWARLVQWTADAWNEIQTERDDWEWMTEDVTFNTIALKGEYTPAEAGITNFASWKPMSFRAYPLAAGVGSEQILAYSPYERFRNHYLLASRKTTYQRPTEITVSPKKSLILGLAPDDVYVVSGQYRKGLTELVGNSDVPGMPARFHNAIVFSAMMAYGTFESAPEVYGRGESQLRVMMSELRMDQLPRITRG